VIEIKGKIVPFELVDPPRGNENQETKDVKVLNREDIVFGYTVKIKYMDHSFYITLNFDEQKNLLEVFVNASSTSPEINSYIQALARMISNQLKHRVPLEKIIKHLDGLDSGNSVLVKFPLQQKGKFIKSIPDLLAKVLSFYGDFNKVKKLIKEHYTKENEESEVNIYEKVYEDKSNNKKSTIQCPSCGSDNVSLSEGCLTCLECGYSKCG